MLTELYMKVQKFKCDFHLTYKTTFCHCSYNWNLDFLLIKKLYTVKKGYWFSRPQTECYWPNSPWPGIIKFFPARESLVSDIRLGTGKSINFFFSVGTFSWRWIKLYSMPSSYRGYCNPNPSQRRYSIKHFLTFGFWIDFIFLDFACLNSICKNMTLLVSSMLLVLVQYFLCQTKI